MDTEKKEEELFINKYKFPPGAMLLIIYQFFSAVGSFCLSLTFPIYMATIMKFSDTTATTIYHARSGMSYFLQIFGAVVSDQFIGRLNAYLIIYPLDLAIIAVMGVLAIYNEFITIIILYFIMGLLSSLISSGMRAFIGDQIPSDKKVMLGAFMHVIYFINNLGAIIASFSAPILHKDIYCFGIECYPLIFSVTFILCSFAYLIIFIGYICKIYLIYPPVNSLYTQAISCIFYGLKTRIMEGKNPNGHWMDYAEKKYDVQFVHDCKVFLGLCFFLFGHPLFWTVFEQMSSIWTLQARFMNGMITDSFYLKADQMQTLNPMLVLVFIPIFEFTLYPFFERVNIKVPFIIALGQFFTAAACCSMIYIQYKIDLSLIRQLKSTEINVNFYNFYNNSITIFTDNQAFQIKSYENKEIIFQKSKNVMININKVNITTLVGDWQNKYFLGTVFLDNNVPTVRYGQISIQENGGYGNVRLFTQNIIKGGEKVTLRGKFGINNNFDLPLVSKDFGSYVECGVGTFDVVDMSADGAVLKTVKLLSAETITLFLTDNYQIFIHKDYIIKFPMIYWQVLPYILLTIGEVLFNVNTGIFLYAEAPFSMKSLMLAVQYFCIAIGNWLILIFKQVLANVTNIYLFLLCGILVFVSGIITVLLGLYYEKEKVVRNRTLSDKKSASAAIA